MYLFIDTCRTNGMSDPAGPVQFSLGDLGGPFGKFSDHSERWTKRTTKTAWSSPEAQHPLGAFRLAKGSTHC